MKSSSLMEPDVIATFFSLLALYVSCFILMLGFGLIGLLLPVRMGLDGVSTDTIGLVLSMYAAGMLLGGLYSRKLIIRVGHIRVFTACAALSAVAILICGLKTDPWTWGAMRLLMGFCLACNFAVFDGWLSDTATEKTRGRIMATSQITIMGAVVVGQFLFNLAPISEPTLFILAAILLCLGLVPLALSRRSGPPITETQNMTLKNLLHHAPFGAVICLFSGVLYGALMNLMPVYAGERGIADFQLSLFMGCAVLGAFLLQFPIGMLSDRFDRRQVLAGLLGVNLAVTLLLPGVGHSGLFMLMLPLVGILTGLLSCIYPMSIAETFDRIRKAEMAAAMGRMLTLYAAGSIAGPALSSKAMSWFGSDALFFFLALFQLLLLGFCIYQMRHGRKALPVEEQEQYVIHTEVGSTLYDLDPRLPGDDTETPNSLETRVAIRIAESNPAAAVKMARELVLANPDKAMELSAALVQVEQIDIGRLYASITRAAPDLSLDIAKMLVSNAPDQANRLVSWLAEHQPETLSRITQAISEQYHVEQEFETPEASAEVPLRRADRDAMHESASELVSHFSEHYPDQAMEIATAVVETLPEYASEVVNILQESEHFDQELMDQVPQQKPEQTPKETG
ncbi:MFS transporter [Neptuniibacter sp. CAU 1671]|uniref:MFS transporter n=1 Tax=Neptuniibacter sp. CAU 1671 TaxID=3032593 RepID=UPI0023D9A829|nr:MFS transporter [Neptuniibacter sp. CAU 1671]MDF2181896.1 MFS transporter [Neptuniibacter sp. CAU 1671]